MRVYVDGLDVCVQGKLQCEWSSVVPLLNGGHTHTHTHCLQLVRGS
jgi:hypothetical protein